MAFQVNGASPSSTHTSAMPPAGEESCIIHFPDSGVIRGDGHSVTVGKPWLRICWPTISDDGAAYWYGLFPNDTTPSVALTSVQAYNPRTAGWTTYSTKAILHRPTYRSVTWTTCVIYNGFEVLITELE